MWDEDSCGTAGDLLHIGAVQWFWDRVINWPSKSDSNLLMVQCAAETMAANWCSWLADAPNIMLLYTGHLSLSEVESMSKVAFQKPPPVKLDQATVQQLGDAASGGVPFWVVLSEPKRLERLEHERNMLQTEAIRLWKSQHREQLEQEKQKRRSSKAAGDQSVKKKRRRSTTAAATPASESPEREEVVLSDVERPEAGMPPEMPLSQQLEVDAQQQVNVFQSMPTAELHQQVQEMLRSVPTPPPAPVEEAAVSSGAPPAPLSKPSPRRKLAPPVRQKFAKPSARSSEERAPSPARSTSPSQPPSPQVTPEHQPPHQGGSELLDEVLKDL